MGRGPVTWTQRFDRYATRTFADAGKKYIEQLPTADAKRRAAYALKALNPYISHLYLIDVNNEALEDYKHDRLNGLGAFDKPATCGTANYDIGVASTVLRFATFELEWMPRAPKLKLVKGPRKQGFPLTWAQQDALWAKLPEHWAKGLCQFMVNTGVRPDEAYGLKWSDRSEIADVFLLQKTKNGEARAVVCNSQALLAVERQEGNGSDYVFPSQSRRTLGEQMHGMSKPWNRAWEAAGLPADKWTRRGPHNLRHTFATRLREAGVSEEDRDLLLGHKRKSISQHYTALVIDRLRPIAELVTRRTESVILRRRVA
jgi:integrase